LCELILRKTPLGAGDLEAIAEFGVGHT